MRKKSEEELIEELKRVSEEHCDGESPTYTEMDKINESPSSSTYKRYFENWNDALKKAGLEVNQERKISKGELEQELRRVSEEHCDGEAPTRGEFDKHTDISPSTYRNRYGSWSEALEEILGECNRYMNINKSKLLDEVDRVFEEHCDGKAPKLDDMDKYGRYGTTTYRNYFGSWSAALRTGGFSIPRREYTPHPEIETSELIEDIKRVKERIGRVPTSIEMDEMGKYSRYIYRREQSYTDLLNEAEMTPFKEKHIDKDDLMEEVKRLSEKYCDGEAPSYNIMRKHGKYSASAYEYRFGTWNEALREFGFRSIRTVNNSRKEIIQDLKRVYKEIQKPISYSELQKYGNFSPPTYAKYSDGYGISSILQANDIPEKTQKDWVLSGEDHPFWKGGGERYYGGSWYGRRREVRLRDKNSCRVCGKNKEKIGQKPHVHHITPVRYWIVENEHEKMNYPRNLISLCPSCHHKLEGRFKGRSHDEFEELAKDYLGIEEEEPVDAGVKQSIFKY